MTLSEAIANEVKLASMLSKPSKHIQELLKIWAKRLQEIVK